MKIPRLILEDLREWLDAAIRWFPGHVGRRLRGIWLRRRVKSLGDAPCVDEGCVVTGGENIRLGARFTLLRLSALYAHGGGTIEVGDDVSCNTNVYLGAADAGRISIGNNVLIGPNTVLRASNHVFSSPEAPINRQGHGGGTIVLEDDVWIGANCTILPDVTIGTHAVVGAGAVVTRDVKPWSIVGGVPAREIGTRPRR